MGIRKSRVMFKKSSGFFFGFVCLFVFLKRVILVALRNKRARK